MTFDIERTGNAFVVCVEGRLDAETAPALYDAVKDALPGATEVTFDFEGLEYISSAGLRVLVAAFKSVSKTGGKTSIVNASGNVRDTLDASGLSDIFGVE